MATETYQLTIEGVLGSSYRATVLHFQGVGVATGDTFAGGESLCLGWESAGRALFLATLPNAYVLTRLVGRRVSAKPSAQFFQNESLGGYAGTRGTDGTGQQTCPSVFLVPSMGTKSGGKIFWPTIPQADLTDSTYSAGWQTAVNAFLAAMLAGFTQAGITWTQCIWSRKLQAASTIAGHNFSPLMGFQSRRRKPAGAVD